METARPNIAETGNWDKFRTCEQTFCVDTAYYCVIIRINVTFKNETRIELSGSVMFYAGAEPPITQITGHRAFVGANIYVLVYFYRYYTHSTALALGISTLGTNGFRWRSRWFGDASRRQARRPPDEIRHTRIKFGFLLRISVPFLPPCVTEIQGFHFLRYPTVSSITGPSHSCCRGFGCGQKPPDSPLLPDCNGWAPHGYRFLARTRAGGTPGILFIRTLRTYLNLSPTHVRNITGDISESAV